jgi:hypothetical protein
MSLKHTLLLSGCLTIVATVAMGQCLSGSALTGVVTDPQGEVVVGAAVTLMSEHPVSSSTGEGGKFFFVCMNQAQKIVVTAEGFQAAELPLKAGVTNVRVQLKLADLKQVVDVQEEDGRGSSNVLTLDRKAIAAMADDPDDFKRQLQALAAVNGGAPGKTALDVDGFQDIGQIPPKSAIASITVAPDLYSAEYASPPYEGGHVEIETKPGGAPSGAVFAYMGPAITSARTPLSETATPANQRHYGFELGGPIQQNKSGYFVSLERRDIAEFGVVDAVVPNATGTAVPFHQAVARPQRLWMGNVRGDTQLNSKSTLSVSYTTRLESLQNAGVGGLTLPEAGYDQAQSANALRVSETTAVNENLVNQVRFSSSWTDVTQQPLSTAPSMVVAGAFTAGGALGGRSTKREQDLIFDEALSWVHGNHSFKFGADGLAVSLRNRDLTLFNGQYLFAGLTTVSALQQYVAAQSGLANSFATSYQAISGNPLVSVHQWQEALYAQDEWKIAPRLTLSLGLRYSVQTLPASFSNLAPRFGVAWSPDRKQLWVIRAHAGLFYTPINASLLESEYRLDGLNSLERMLYSPLVGTTPIAAPGSISVENLRLLANGLRQTPSVQAQIAIERSLPKHWQAQVSAAYADSWDVLRSRNINAPFTSSWPEGENVLLAPRPIVPGVNIFQYEPSGVLHGPVLFASVSNHAYKRFNIFAGYLYMDLVTDADSPDFLPESSYWESNQLARPSWEVTHQMFLISQVSLPGAISFSSEFAIASGRPYDVTTGQDNNGDGSYNDRPSLVTQPGPGVFPTPFGLLDTAVVDGNLPRDIGTMPMTVHLDAALSRTFKLRRRGLSGDTNQAITASLRAANLLNHTNVTAISGVVGSPTFGQAVLAEAGRRIEAGLRFTF